MNKAKLISISIAAIGVFGVTALVGYVGLTKVAAAVSTSNGFSQLVNNIASKFNLNPTDVQQVFTDTRAQQYSQRLDQAVAAGQITADQKILILNKEKEVSDAITAINNKQLTASERASEIQTVMNDLRAWANTNKIPLRFVEFGFKGGMGGRGRMMGGFGMMDFN